MRSGAISHLDLRRNVQADLQHRLVRYFPLVYKVKAGDTSMLNNLVTG